MRALFYLLVATAPALTVGGDLPSPGTLSLAQLEAMNPATFEWKEGGASHRVRGVPLDRILSRFGFTSGPMNKDTPVSDKRAGWKKAVRATAADGFEAVFSCAELFAEM